MEKMKGFTLFEILLAMAILGIISVSGFSAYTVSLQKARDSGRKKALQSMQQALESYQNDYGVYPAGDEEGKVVACYTGNRSCEWGEEMAVNGRVYMQKLPIDPSVAYSMFYRTDTSRSKYQIYARLENANDPAIPDEGSYDVVCGRANCNYGISSANAGVEDVLQ